MAHLHSPSHSCGLLFVEGVTRTPYHTATVSGTAGVEPAFPDTYAPGTWPLYDVPWLLGLLDHRIQVLRQSGHENTRGQSTAPATGSSVLTLPSYRVTDCHFKEISWLLHLVPSLFCRPFSEN